MSDMPKLLRTETLRIVFKDRREGTLTRAYYEDGSDEITEIVVTKNESGYPAHDVYREHRNMLKFIFGFVDLRDWHGWKAID
jgi:hypothetical protein